MIEAPSSSWFGEDSAKILLLYLCPPTRVLVIFMVESKDIGDRAARPGFRGRPTMNSQRMRHRRLPPMLCCHLFFLVTGLYASEPLPVEAHLDKLVLQALEQNPRVTAARRRLAKAAAEHEAVRAFFDPTLVASLGTRDSTTAVPGASRSTGLDNDSVMARLGIEMPLHPGAYLSLGAAQRYLSDPDDTYDSLYQSTLGARLWIPLLQDRGLQAWHADDLEALETVKAASYDVWTVAQEVREEVEVAYIDMLLAFADTEATAASADRFRQLLDEAQTLVKLQVIPEYQLSAARLELALGQDNEQQARELYDTRRIELQELVGATNDIAFDPTRDHLVSWADALAGHVATATVDQACERRGLFLAAASRLRAARAETRGLKEAVKPNLALSLTATWQGEDEDGPWGRDELLTEQNAGSEVALVWQQPWGRREERAEVASSIASAEELREELRENRLQIAAELAAARVRVTSASARLRMVSGAVQQAAKALSAEQERFRLGQARSRHVLDAQKDLTAATRRQNGAAASLLKAQAAMAYAAGYPGRPLPVELPGLGDNPITNKTKTAQQPGGHNP